MKHKVIKILLIFFILLLSFGIIFLTVNIYKDHSNKNNNNNINELVKEEPELPKEILVESIDFINTIDKLDKNKTYQVELDIKPENADNKNIFYSSNDYNICTIDNNGLLTSVNKGLCIITVESSNSITNTLSIEIYNSRELKSINLDNTNYTIEVNKDTKIDIITNPSNAEYNNITCTSSNNNIFTTNTNDKSCVLQGTKSGNATLTVKVDDFTKTVNIKVIKKQEISVASINIGRGNKFKNLTHTSFSNYLKNLDIIGIQEARDSNGTEKLVKNIANDLNSNYYYGTKAPAGNAVITKFTIKSKSETTLPSKTETRTLVKVIVNINNVDISFYDTHIIVSSHEKNSKCTASTTDTKQCPYRVKQLQAINKIIQADPNPVIIVADWNFIGNIYFDMLGNNLIKVGYDTIRNKDYDSIWIIPKDKIEYVSNDTKETKDKVTDHNLVISKLNIIN